MIQLSCLCWLWRRLLLAVSLLFFHCFFGFLCIVLLLLLMTSMFTLPTSLTLFTRLLGHL